VGKLVSASLSARTLKPFGLDAEKSFTIGRLLRYSAMALAFIFGLSIIGIDLSAIGVLFGVMGIGIGFGLQSIIADFFAGITLISMALIKEGDRIDVGEFQGTIIHIRLMNTELNTFENETLIIPNSYLTGGVIHNNSYKDRRVVLLNEVGVSYNSDLDEVITVLKEVANRNPWRQKNSEILVRVKEFGDSGIQIQLRTWLGDVEHRADAKSWTNLEIWRTFVRNNIEIPFPQRVIHISKKEPSRPEPSDTPDFVEGSSDTSDFSDGD
jgi:small-conductance mechanosensitive channel